MSKFVATIVETVYGVSDPKTKLVVTIAEKVAAVEPTIPTTVLKIAANVDSTLRRISDYGGNNTMIYAANDKTAIDGQTSFGKTSAPAAIIDVKTASGGVGILVSTNGGTQTFKTDDSGNALFGSSGQAKMNTSGQLVMDKWKSKNSFEDDWWEWGSDEITLAIANTVRAWWTGNGLVISNGAVSGAINAAGVFEVISTSRGVILPRMTGAQAEAIASGTIPDGLVVYINNGNGTNITSTGFWGMAAGSWAKLN